MVYELVYPISIDIVWKQGYLNKLLEFECENEETAEWFKYMRSRLEEWKSSFKTEKEDV
jgi:hypothetical protein